MDMDQIFCSNQIVIPPTLPSILKKYAKAAIRTQPYDLLVWSAAYFKAMSTGNTPPIKPRLEYPLPENRMLTMGYVKLLVYQFGRSGEVQRYELTEKWNDVCLPPDTLYNILRIGSFAHTVNWPKFVAITLGFLEDTLKGTMLRVCEVFTEEPDGGNAMIPLECFLDLYRYLGEMDCGIAEVETVSTEVQPDDKKPCLPDDQSKPASGRDIDSVIKDIGEADSAMSVDTRLEGTGAELEWPNIESGSDSDLNELKQLSEPSDEGATSRYGIEIMKPVQDEDDFNVKLYGQEMKRMDGGKESPTRKENTEIEVLLEDRRRGISSDADSEVALNSEEDVKDEAEIPLSTSLVDVTPTTDKNFMNQLIEGEMKDEEAAETEHNSESDKSVKILMQEKDYDETESDKDSQMSENKKELLDMVAADETLDKSTSIIELRPTLDRDLRKKVIEGGLLSEEERRAAEEKAAAEISAKLHIEEEAKKKFHMHVPGIGPVLPSEMMDALEDYMKCCAERQAGMVMPRNIRHFLCPPLDLESLKQVQGLQSFLEETLMLTESEHSADLPPNILELIRHDPRLDMSSSLDTSLDSETPRLYDTVKEVSSLTDSEEFIGRNISLCTLVNQKKN